MSVSRRAHAASVEPWYPLTTYRVVSVLVIAALIVTALVPAGTRAASMPVLPTRPRILTSAREVTGPVTPEVQAAVSRVPVLGAPAAFLSATTPNTYTLRGPDNGRLR